jgi:hypothetical protein
MGLLERVWVILQAPLLQVKAVSSYHAAARKTFTAMRSFFSSNSL